MTNREERLQYYRWEAKRARQRLEALAYEPNPVPSSIMDYADVYAQRLAAYVAVRRDEGEVDSVDDLMHGCEPSLGD